MENADYQTNGSERRTRGFLRVPNGLLDNLYSQDRVRRKKARVYLCLLRHAYFTDGVVTLCRKHIRCRRGEWVTTLRQLEEKTDVPKTQVSRLLDKLVEEGCICVRKLGRFTQVKLLHPEEQEKKKPVADKPSPAAEKQSGKKDKTKKATGSEPARQPNYKRFKS